MVSRPPRALSRSSASSTEAAARRGVRVDIAPAPTTRSLALLPYLLRPPRSCDLIAGSPRLTGVSTTRRADHGQPPGQAREDPQRLDP
jgi:hypothetical protein